MKKSIIALLSICMAASLMGACKPASSTSTPPVSPSTGSESTSGDSTSSDSTNPEVPDSSSTGADSTGGDSSTGDSTGGDSSTGDSTGGSGSSDTELPDEDPSLTILQNAYALASGTSLSGTHTLTGVVTEIEKTDKGDVCLTFVVGNYTQYPMYCYWLQDADFVQVGDTITVSGTIKNYNGKIEYDKPTLVSHQGGGSGGGTQQPDDNSLTILQNAYALASGASLSGTHTLTGVVTEIEKTSQGDVCLTFVVGNYTQYPMYCYWLQDADFVQVGDTITVSGTIKNYNGKIEYDKPTLVSHQSGSSSGGNSGGNSGGSTSYTYTDFTSSEKALFREYFGEVIPFAPNNEYYVKEYSYYYEDDNETEVGINFYTFGNTQADFNAYRQKFSSYEYEGTDQDDYGDTWYFYNGDDYYVDLTYYYDSEEDGYWLDVYAYTLVSGDITGGSSGGSTGGNTGGSTQQPDNLMTNAGKGLPTGENGVYHVDFTKATYVKDVHDQGYYLDGCPTLSTTEKNPAVLVVPVQFSDVTAASKGYTIDNIRKAWLGSVAEVDYYSVHDYYYISSYGKLDLDITIVNEWFTPKNNSSYYLNAKMDYSGQQVECGDQYIIDEFLAYYSKTNDLSQFDSDNNGIIDSIVLINTLDINADVTMKWAYRYWNIYTDDQGYYYEYDGVSANDYLWASYSFMHESYDANGNTSYNDTSVINTYTFIHEFGHVLGADDYYDTSYSGGEGPMAGYDMMDSMMGDHNAYTKFNYGWLTSSRLVVADGSVTLTLEDFSQNGDTIIIANNWDEKLGAYQEYYILVYYRNVGLNAGDDAGYFPNDGVLVYHVNASLYSEVYDNETYYDVYNNNTDPSDEYGTQDNLIEYVKSAAGNFTYVVGDSISANTTDDQGNKIAYTFTVDALTDSTATITFTKNA